ncbi:bifunctional adenosylcobinamide kinase/adenosylcobinamide-phosphate guanylyltransferase [Nigerium massiliense]|uniref:bifunctional adenosylcobinamide kinase/adenosylcobinamide-phosphate guanylyltransferase n=1 Tax=Nigerium massiliense TaxID=1522317 RepID=UPI00058F1E46|nr:bifunctional adenosylcobinamide kinase/adenosylcobinamide-phosphate guanylyltransferase [Nigerium massiliense]
MRTPATKTLVTGGVRSGKSRHAEERCAALSPVLYLTPGYPADPATDPEWAARVQAHQRRRPAAWTTVETVDLASALASADRPVLIDCLGTWLTRSIDGWDGWERPAETWRPLFDEALTALTDAWSGLEHPAVAVTNEVGWGVVPATPSGRLFADLLGTVNQAIGRLSDEVVLCVAGRTLLL